MKDIHVVIATFKNKISQEEIPYFRGSIIRLSENLPLFHNHMEDGFLYGYPLVQYKRIDGHAAILGINEGGEAIKKLFEDRVRYECQLGKRPVEMELIGIRTEKFTVACLDEDQSYTIKGWLPLNSQNYRQYLDADGLVGRITMLERILVGNILSFLKGIDLYCDVPLRCRILQLDGGEPYGYKHMELLSFSVKFRTNVSLPSYIGLGKSSSLNNGVITLMK
jgi:hypothetical protein